MPDLQQVPGHVCTSCQGPPSLAPSNPGPQLPGPAKCVEVSARPVLAVCPGGQTLPCGFVVCVYVWKWGNTPVSLIVVCFG